MKKPELPTSESKHITDNENNDSEETTSNETETESNDSPDSPIKASAAARLLEPLVLAHVLNPNYQPVKPKVIGKQMGLASDEQRALKIAIRRLVQQGKVSWGGGHQVRPVGPPALPTAAKDKKPANELPAADDSPEPVVLKPAAKTGEITGHFRRAAGGFGFVRPTGTARDLGRSLDVFVPARDTLDAADGDVVRVRLAKSKFRNKDGEQRTSGEIVEVLERETHQFVGVYRERDGEAFVDVDGKVFATSISVGDPGAKDAVPEDKVVIEMVRFPSPANAGEAVITEVLGKRGEPGVDTLSIIREFGLPGEFSEAAMEAARAEADKFDEAIGDRFDLTGETVITIDPIDARDFDDAISLKRIEKGHWELDVHIADVSHFVRSKSPLDVDARDRATSVYLPDRVIPMLPEIISNNLASLQPHKVRYCLTATIEFTAEGIPVAAEVRKSAIKSCRRFAYEEVDEYLADPGLWREKLTPQVHDLLGKMHELALVLRQRRLKGGAIELTLPEVKIDLNKQGEVTGAHLVKNTVSHQIIEEFMLAANEAVARLLDEQKLNFLRRVHEPPNPKKLTALTNFVRELGIECDSMESRFEIKRVVALVAERPEAHAVNYAILRSMQKAIYSPTAEGHYALNSDHYCHFTSPIRRYPDLTIHRMFESLARGKRPPDDFTEQTLLAEHCSEREQRAQKAERELVKVKLLMHLSTRIGEKMDAVITGVEDFGLFAQGIELPAEGLVHVRTLSDDYYRYDAATHTLAGHREGNSYRLGDLIRVEVAHVDIDRRELDFRVVERLAQAPRPKPEKSGKKKDRPTRGKNTKRKQAEAAKGKGKKTDKRK
jgi:ribonuclease R